MKKFTSFFLIFSLIVVSDNLIAQENSSSNVSGYALEEIIVTARKREESTQDVPIAITALDARTIERSFLTDLDDLERFAPNVVLDRNRLT